MNILSNLIFNKYTLILAIIASVSGYIYFINNKIDFLQESLKIESSNVEILKTELKKTNDILISQEKKLIEQIDNILEMEKEKQIVINDLQKSIEKTNNKDVNKIIVKKTKLTEKVLNKAIKRNIKIYNEKERIK